MLYLSSIISILTDLLIIIPSLVIIAFVTVAERKSMASMHRRLGPNIVGVFGFMQPFADALKLLLKEYVLPALANKILFFSGPYITLMFSLLTYAMMPYGPGLGISDFNLGILYILSTFSLSTYGILLSGWSANSKYAFLGSLRSTAQLISYELILTSGILLTLFIWGSFNLSSIIESQKSTWSVWPLAPVFYVFFKSCVAETNRAPFDLAEAESELVSGYMTEHAAGIFVSFFLGEYASIVLMSMFSSILFLGAYLIRFIPLLLLFWFISKFLYDTDFVSYYDMFGIFFYKSFFFNTTSDGFLTSFTLGYKSIIIIFGFILIRACYPRVRFDQLIIYCWTILLAIIVSLIILIPCILYGLEMIPSNDILFSGFVLMAKPIYRSFSSSSRLAIKRDREDSNEIEETNSKRVRNNDCEQTSKNDTVENDFEQASKNDSDKGLEQDLSQKSEQGSNQGSEQGSDQGSEHGSDVSMQSSLIGSSPSLGPYSPTNNQPAPPSPTQHFPRTDLEERESRASSSYDGSSDVSRLSERAKRLAETAEHYNEINYELEEGKELQERVNRGETLSKGDQTQLDWVKGKHFDSSEITDWDKTRPEVYTGQINENTHWQDKLYNKADAKADRAERIRDSLLDDYADPSTEPADYIGGDD